MDGNTIKRIIFKLLYALLNSTIVATILSVVFMALVIENPSALGDFPVFDFIQLVIGLAFIFYLIIVIRMIKKSVLKYRAGKLIFKDKDC